MRAAGRRPASPGRSAGASPPGFPLRCAGRIMRAAGAPHTSNNAPREDETRSVRLSAHNRGLTLWGFSPRVSVVREQRESNAQLQDYKRTSGELQFVRLF